MFIVAWKPEGVVPCSAEMCDDHEERCDTPDTLQTIRTIVEAYKQLRRGSYFNPFYILLSVSTGARA
jgi:hypothetical protein